MKTINNVNEMIEVMQHYANGGEVEKLCEPDDWYIVAKPLWDWKNDCYRIKEKKKTVTIEKWLIKLGDTYYIKETSNINAYFEREKIKLIETYEVEV